MRVVQTLCVTPRSEAFRRLAATGDACRDHAALQRALRRGRLFELLQDGAQIVPAEHLVAVGEPDAIRLARRGGDASDFRNKILRRRDVVQRGAPLAPEAFSVNRRNFGRQTASVLWNRHL